MSKMDWYYENVEDVLSCDFIPWEMLAGKTVFVTGGTGLLGTAFIKTVLYVSKAKCLHIRIVALVRDNETAKKRFAKELVDGELSLVEGNVEKLPCIKEKLHYIVHGASKTASRSFVEAPVETIRTSVLGTDNVLRLARRKKVEGFVYLSSMEMYGFPKKGHMVKETDSGSLSPLDVRNSYPIAKQLCESLVCGYSKEYLVPAKIVRLTQIIGAGIGEKDNRAFAYFLKCANNKESIVMKTKAVTERSYLFSLDAVTAILMVLIKGENGHAYNAADERSYCSIAEMANKIADTYGIDVKYAEEDIEESGFPKPVYMNLDTTALREMGWYPLRNAADFSDAI